MDSMTLETKEERIYKIPECAKDNSKENEKTKVESVAETMRNKNRLDDINAKLDLLLEAQQLSLK